LRGSVFSAILEVTEQVEGEGRMPGLLIAGISLLGAWKQAQNRKLAATAAATPVLPPAGWYADPWRVATFRWWDGIQWTHHVHLSEATAISQ
jgi:hypothetical protein